MGGSSSLRLTQRRRTFIVTNRNFGFFFGLVIFVYIKSLGPRSPVHFVIKFWKNDRIRVWTHTPQGRIYHDGLGRKFLSHPHTQSAACTVGSFILTTYFPHKMSKLLIWLMISNKNFCFYEFLELFKIFLRGLTNYYFFLMLYQSQFSTDNARHTLFR